MPTRKFRKGDRVICFRKIGHPAPGVVTAAFYGDLRLLRGALGEAIRDMLSNKCEVRFFGGKTIELVALEHIELSTTQEIVNDWHDSQEG